MQRLVNTQKAAEDALAAAQQEAKDSAYHDAWIGLDDGPGIRVAHLLAGDEYEYWHDNQPIGNNEALRLVVQCFEAEVPA